jgi:RNA polymerase sigma factor (sigma-70 family)
MSAYQAGHYPAFEELYRRHSGKVYGYLKKRISQPTAIDEVFQAVFLKLHQARGRYRKDFPFTQWLFVIARSVMLDHFRKEKRQVELDDARTVEELEGVPAPVAASNSSAEETQSTQDLLRGLKQQHQQIVRWRILDELTYEEIARRSSLSTANVRQIFHRALKALRGKRSAP